MSLKDIEYDGEYDELLPTKQSKLNLSRKIKPFKKYFLIILIGIIIGVILSQSYIEPQINPFSNEYVNCVTEKEILTKEINCLYNQLENPQEIINQCFES